MVREAPFWFEGGHLDLPSREDSIVTAVQPLFWWRNLVRQDKMPQRVHVWAIVEMLKVHLRPLRRKLVEVRGIARLSHPAKRKR